MFMKNFPWKAILMIGAAVLCAFVIICVAIVMVYGLYTHLDI